MNIGWEIANTISYPIRVIIIKWWLIKLLKTIVQYHWESITEIYIASSLWFLRALTKMFGVPFLFAIDRTGKQQFTDVIVPQITRDCIINILWTDYCYYVMTCFYCSAPTTVIWWEYTCIIVCNKYHFLSFCCGICWEYKMILFNTHCYSWSNYIPTYRFFWAVWC